MGTVSQRRGGEALKIHILDKFALLRFGNDVPGSEPAVESNPFDRARHAQELQ